MQKKNDREARMLEMDQSWKKFEFLPCPISVHRTEYTADHYSSTHNHDFVQILYCLKGSIAHTIGENVYDCRAGSAVVVVPGMMHSFDASAETSLLYLEIPYNAFENKLVDFHPCTIALTLLSRFCREEGFAVPECFEFTDNRKEAEELLLSIENTDLQPKNTAKLFMLLERFCAMLIPLTSTQIKTVKKIYESRARPIVEALDYLNTHYAKKIYYPEILRAIALCRTDFYNYFRLFIDTTYSVYLQMVRVCRAHRAIAFTQYSLSYIANMCGFGDNAYMTKCYKKYRGYTPTEERSRRTFQRPEYAHLRITRDFFE